MNRMVLIKLVLAAGAGGAALRFASHSNGLAREQHQVAAAFVVPTAAEHPNAASSWSVPSDVFLSHDMRTGLAGCDVVVMLRLQSERMKGGLLPSAGEYFKHYGLTSEKLAMAKPDAIVMHPGPMNRGVEIDSVVADGARSVILPQVTFGIAVRMAVLSMLAGA